jgi:hypothetical protein
LNNRTNEKKPKLGKGANLPLADIGNIVRQLKAVFNAAKDEIFMGCKGISLADIEAGENLIDFVESHSELFNRENQRSKFFQACENIEKQLNNYFELIAENSLEEGSSDEDGEKSLILNNEFKKSINTLYVVIKEKIENNSHNNQKNKYEAELLKIKESYKQRVESSRTPSENFILLLEKLNHEVKRKLAKKHYYDIETKLDLEIGFYLKKFFLQDSRLIKVGAEIEKGNEIFSLLLNAVSKNNMVEYKDNIENLFEMMCHIECERKYLNDLMEQLKDKQEDGSQDPLLLLHIKINRKKVKLIAWAKHLEKIKEVRFSGITKIMKDIVIFMDRHPYTMAKEGMPCTMEVLKAIDKVMENPFNQEYHEHLSSLIGKAYNAQHDTGKIVTGLLLAFAGTLLIATALVTILPCLLVGAVPLAWLALETGINIFNKGMTMAKQNGLGATLFGRLITPKASLCNLLNKFGYLNRPPKFINLIDVDIDDVGQAVQEHNGLAVEALPASGYLCDREKYVISFLR